MPALRRGDLYAFTPTVVFWLLSDEPTVRPAGFDA
jgi:hypothetical protein